MGFGGQHCASGGLLLTEDDAAKCDPTLDRGFLRSALIDEEGVFNSVSLNPLWW